MNEALEMDPNFSITYFSFAYLAIKKDQLEDAWRLLEQGIEKGILRSQIKLENLESNPDFTEMKKEPRWIALMEKYFPDEMKE